MSTLLSFNNKILTVGNNALSIVSDPYNPLGLPAYTMRFRFGQSDFNPNNVTSPSWPSSAVWTQVSSSPNVWDFTYANPVWTDENYSAPNNGSLFYSLTQSTHVYTVLGGNTTGVTNMSSLFRSIYLYSITNAFDTSSVTKTNYMFAENANYHGELPMFDFSHVTEVTGMFSHSSIEDMPDYDFSSAGGMITYLCDYCTQLQRVPNFTFTVNNITLADACFRMCGAVESGALAMYQQLSGSTTITSHQNTFSGCGSNTTTGAAELARIPSNWGGTGSY